ncbi:hypothetical protein FHG87_013939 [Trinorchestia longiramus]|nr:hypothetical protein FHG87_013939 [Trinorchestia longiramus]
MALSCGAQGEITKPYICRPKLEIIFSMRGECLAEGEDPHFSAYQGVLWSTQALRMNSDRLLRNFHCHKSRQCATAVSHSGGSFWWVILVGHSGGSFWWVILVGHSGGSFWWDITLQNSVSDMMKVLLPFLLLLVVMVCADLTHIDHGVELGRPSLISFDVVDVGAQEMRAECNGLCHYTSITDPCEKYGFLRSSCFRLESSGSAKDGCYCCVRLSN